MEQASKCCEMATHPLNINMIRFFQRITAIITSPEANFFIFLNVIFLLFSLLRLRIWYKSRDLRGIFVLPCFALSPHEIIYPV